MFRLGSGCGGVFEFENSTELNFIFDLAVNDDRGILWEYLNDGKARARLKPVSQQ